jgi:hypothetical protein
MRRRRSSRRILVSGVLAVAAVAGGATYAAVASGGGNDNAAAKVNARLARIANLQIPSSPNAVSLKRAAGAHPPLVPLTGPQEPVPTGIINMSQAPFPSEEYGIENRWQKLLPGGAILQLYAGADGSNPSQGLVIVWTVPSTAPAVVIRTPDKIGALRIVAVNGNTFTLSSTSGKQAVFDLTSRSFTSG